MVQNIWYRANVYGGVECIVYKHKFPTNHAYGIPHKLGLGM